MFKGLLLSSDGCESQTQTLPQWSASLSLNITCNSAVCVNPSIYCIHICFFNFFLWVWFHLILNNSADFVSVDLCYIRVQIHPKFSLLTQII